MAVPLSVRDPGCTLRCSDAPGDIRVGPDSEQAHTGDTIVLDGGFTLS